MPECQRPRLARAFAQAIGSLDGFQIVSLGRVSRVHIGQQGAQFGEHHRPGGVNPATLVAEPETFQLVVVFVLYVHVGESPSIQLASPSIRRWFREWQPVAKTAFLVGASGSLKKAGLLDDVTRRFLLLLDDAFVEETQQPRFGLWIRDVQRSCHLGVFHWDLE